MRILSFFFTSVLFLGFFMGSVHASGIDDLVQNAGGGTSSPHDTLPNLGSHEGTSAEEKTNAIIYQIINIILAVCGTVAVFLIVIGGVRYTISAGDEDMMNGAKKIIEMALLGLLVIILAYAIVGNVANFLAARG